ncbi:mechanosensitive ion channel [Candidatus Halobeggiatoa sp. HSG11]|nr:mechanosensitive ion channel [Candidatus Halobeggiatoa sp. HSG11]
MKKKYFALLVVISLLSASVWAWLNLNLFEKKDDAIHIAFVGPLSGKDANQGESMVQAIEIYIDYINQNRNAQQKKIVLDKFDDKNDLNTATKVALEVANSKAVAVIGHRRSDCSIPAGKIYKQYKIPAITPTSSVTKITQDNEWYFRTFFGNDLQGKLLAKYAKEFLLKPKGTASIIYIDTPYGKELADIFGETLRDMEVEVKYKWKLTNNGLEQKQQMKEIVSDLQAKSNDAGLIFLATQSNEGVKLVKSIKDIGIKNQLIAPDSYAKFQEGFKNYPKEINTPGYYTEGIYVFSFLLDMGNRFTYNFHSKYKEKYKKHMPGASFYTVDAAIVIIEAIKQIQNQQQELQAFRKNLRDTIASFNTPEKAIKGTTGLNYFDENGNISKPISMGIFTKGHLVSAPLQLINHNGSNNSEQRHKTVVYTGIQFNGINNIDLNNFTYTPDFYLWFRFKKEHDGQTIRPQEIKFINLVTSPTSLNDNLIRLKKPIKKEVTDGYTYLLYRINNLTFKEMYRSTYNLQTIFIEQEMMGVSFHHRQLDKNKLVYVHDVLGMGHKQKLLLDENTDKQKLISLADWQVADSNFFQNVTRNKPLGNPRYLGEKDIEYSTFNANIFINSNQYAYQRIIPRNFITDFFIFTCVATLLLMILNYTHNNYSKSLWFVQTIFAFLLLISTEVFIESIEINVENIRPFVLTTFQTLWWLIPAVLLDVAINRFVWMPLEEKTRRSVPKLMRFLVSSIIYILALFGIVAFVFNEPIASLLATGGLFAGIIGFAVQFNLSNIFSGIALSIEYSFRVGDWVKIGKFAEGIVVDMNWRAIKIKTRRQYILSIPNSVVSKSDIHNFSYPDNQYWLMCTIHLDPKHDPIQIDEILMNAIFSVEEGVLKDVKPFIRLESIEEVGVSGLVASYVIFFKTENYQYKSKVLKNVWQHIWMHLNQAGVIKSKAEIKTSKTAEALTSPELNKILNKGNLLNMIN